MKDPVHLANPTMPNLPHERDRLQPAEAFFDPLPLSLADGVARDAAWCGHQSRCRRAVPGSAPHAASPADSGTLSRNPACQTLCRRPRSPVVCREASPTSPAPRRVPPCRWPETLPRPRSVRCGSPPAGSRSNSTSTLCPRLCAPAARRDRFSMHASHSTSAPRESSRWDCRDRPAEA